MRRGIEKASASASLWKYDWHRLELRDLFAMSEREGGGERRREREREHAIAVCFSVLLDYAAFVAPSRLHL